MEQVLGVDVKELGPESSFHCTRCGKYVATGSERRFALQINSHGFRFCHDCVIWISNRFYGALYQDQKSTEYRVRRPWLMVYLTRMGAGQWLLRQSTFHGTMVEWFKQEVWDKPQGVETVLLNAMPLLTDEYHTLMERV